MKKRRSENEKQPQNLEHDHSRLFVMTTVIFGYVISLLGIDGDLSKKKIIFDDERVGEKNVSPK